MHVLYEMKFEKVDLPNDFLTELIGFNKNAENMNKSDNFIR